MSWRIREITQEDAREMSTWRYGGEYSLYDADPGDAESFLDPANGYFAVVDDAGELVGHGCFGHDARVPGGDYGEDAIDFGTGMRPDLTGAGGGTAFLTLVCDEARKRWPDKPLRTTVAAFNERAQHLVRKLGFQEQALFRNSAGREFTIFIRER